MNSLSNGLPTIIHEKINFSCFSGFALGTIDTSVNDQGNTEFPTVINVNTNLGRGSITLTLKGNETIKKSVNGIVIEVSIFEWNCTKEKLSFHAKAVMFNTVINKLSCTVINTKLSGKRYSAIEYKQKMKQLINYIKQNN